MGAVSASLCLAGAAALGVVPALVLMLTAERSPLPLLDALLMGLSAVVLGHGGSVAMGSGMLEGTIALTPLGMTVLLVVVSAVALRRTGRRLDLVTADGGLREGALRDAGATLGAHVLVYAAGMGVLAALGNGGSIAPVVVSAVFSGAMVSLLGGLAGLIAAVRRPAFGNRPAVRALDLLPTSARPLARSLGIVAVGLPALGLLTVSVMALVRVRAMQGISAQLDPGAAGVVLLFILHLALLPTFGLWALAVLLGGAVTLGTGTRLTLDGFDSGVMPLLPILGALPPPGDAPMITWGLLLLPQAVLILAAVPLVRGSLRLPARERWVLWALQPLVVTVLVLVLLGLSVGTLGSARLAHIGPVMATVFLPLLGQAVLAVVLVVLVLGTPLRSWVAERTRAVRRRVEREEQREAAERDGAAAGAVRTPADD